jgi:hypothetical protein
MLIYRVTHVYVARNEDPKKLIVHASGLTATAGWTSPRLVPVDVSIPERPLDPAILQFNFEADRPKGAALQVLTPIHTSLEISPEGAVDGVTVHAQTNSVTVHVSMFLAPAAALAVSWATPPAMYYTGPDEHTPTTPYENPPATYHVGERLATTMVTGEEHLTTVAVGEEITTLVVGEEGPGPFGCL